MKRNFNPQQKKLLLKVRNDAQELIKLCEEAEEGKITAEQFESRVSKALAGAPAVKP